MSQCPAPAVPQPPMLIMHADRKLTAEFLRLQSHHLFESHFCRVRRPNEKVHV